MDLDGENTKQSTTTLTTLDGETEGVEGLPLPDERGPQKLDDAVDSQNGTTVQKPENIELEPVTTAHTNLTVANGADAADTRNGTATAPGPAGSATVVWGAIATARAGVVAENEVVIEQLTVEDNVHDEDNPAYLSGAPLLLLTFGLCMATFVIALDNTIIATAIPKISTEFNSLNDVGWYGSSYLLATTALQPSFGRIYTYFNVKYVYLGALAIFEVGSIVFAAAVNSNMLIVGRTVAGAGASGLFSGGMTIVGGSVALRRRPLYIALLSSMFGISSVVGPLLGGVFTDKVTWRWCFWINLPVGAVAVISVFFFYKHPPRTNSTLSWKRKILELDIVGAVLLVGAIVCLLIALQWGGMVYAWGSINVWGCLLGFAFQGSLFIFQQIRRGDRATIPPRVLTQRTVLCSSLYSCFMNMGIYVHLFYLPFYFQAVKGTTAVESGIRTIPYLCSIIVCSIAVGGGITAIGVYKQFMILGPILFTIGAYLIYTLSVDTESAKWVGYQLLAGFGAGAGIQIPFISIQVVLNSKDMPTGNSIALFFNSLGGAIAISVAQNLFQNGLYKNIKLYAPLIPPQAVIEAGATSLQTLIPPQYLPGVLEAYSISLDQAFIIAIITGGLSFFSALFVENKSVKGQTLVPGGA